MTVIMPLMILRTMMMLPAVPIMMMIMNPLFPKMSQPKRTYPQIKEN